MSDHGDAPEPQTDITDLYAFQKPGDPERSVIILNVNPAAPTRAAFFDPQASYEIKIDTNNDRFADIAFHFLFSQPKNGMQLASVYRATGAEAEKAGAVGHLIINPSPVSLDDKERVTTQSGYQFYAGLRSDPFFFDYDGFFNHFQWTGKNVNAISNVFSIALEIPNYSFGNHPRIDIWARTMIRAHGQLLQIDQAGRPGTSPLFFARSEHKQAFNESHPSLQYNRFLPRVISVLQEEYGMETSEARILAQKWLPDLLPFDPRSPDTYPNGRWLNDDTVDSFARAVTRGRSQPNPLTGNFNLLDHFPYLGAPYPVPKPEQETEPH